MEVGMVKHYLTNIGPKLCWICDGCGKGVVIERDHGLPKFPDGWKETFNEIFCPECRNPYGYESINMDSPLTISAAEITCFLDESVRHERRNRYQAGWNDCIEFIKDYVKSKANTY